MKINKKIAEWKRDRENGREKARERRLKKQRAETRMKKKTAGKTSNDGMTENRIENEMQYLSSLTGHNIRWNVGSPSVGRTETRVNKFSFNFEYFWCGTTKWMNQIEPTDDRTNKQRIIREKI